MSSLTKHDLILWINHAVAYFESIGKKQQELATALGIEPSRLSEMKIGKGKLSSNLIEKITELCGAPRRNPGRFEYVELYSDLDSFFSELIPASKAHFCKKILDFLSYNYGGEVLINKLAERMKHPSSREDIIESINDLLENSKFHDICLDYQKFLKKNYSPKSDQWLYEFKIDDISVSDSMVLHALYFAWYVKQYIADYRFGQENAAKMELCKDITPVVITGERILSFGLKDIINFPLNKEIENIWGDSEVWGVRRIYSHWSLFKQIDPGADEIPEPLPDRWKDVICQVYLSENMNYHFLIHMTERMKGFQSDDIGNLILQSNDRLAIVENIKVTNLYKEVKELMKWLGIPRDSLYELKQKIAKAGGYVPGAKVL